jgi:hypothetical protein
MPRYRFQWANIMPYLIQELASGLKHDGDAIESLKECYGSRPKPEFIQDAWPILLEEWLPNDLNAATQIAAALKIRDLGNIEIEDSITYLKTCRNTSGLRDVVIAAFITLGELATHTSQSTSEDASDRLQLKFNDWVDSVRNVNSSWATNLDSEIFSYALELETILDDIGAWLLYFEDCDIYPAEVKKELQKSLEDSNKLLEGSTYIEHLNTWKQTAAYALVEGWLFKRAQEIDWSLISGDDLFVILENNGNSDLEPVIDQIMTSTLIPSGLKKALNQEYSSAYAEEYDASD